jgi:hypothetical protein
VSEALKELRSALAEIEERRRVEQELAERQRRAGPAELPPDDRTKVLIPMMDLQTRSIVGDGEAPVTSSRHQETGDDGDEPRGADARGPGWIPRVGALARRWLNTIFRR